MKTYNYIYDKDQMLAFHQAIFGGEYALTPHEMIFMAASARSKELTQQERKEIGISNAEMYHNEYVEGADFADLYRKACRFETNTDGYISMVGRVPFPAKTLTLYVTVNPVSIKKAFLLRKAEVEEALDQFIQVTDPDNNESVRHIMLRCLKRSNRVATKAISRKNWFDLDIDYESNYNSDIRSAILSAVSDQPWANRVPKTVIVWTKGGCHVLFESKHLSFHPQLIVDRIKSSLGEVIKETAFSSGGCPLPGTLQRGYKVTSENWFF